MSVFLGIVIRAFVKRRFLAEILEILHFDLLPGLDLARLFSAVFCLCQVRHASRRQVRQRLNSRPLRFSTTTLSPLRGWPSLKNSSSVLMTGPCNRGCAGLQQTFPTHPGTLRDRIRSLGGMTPANGSQNRRGAGRRPSPQRSTSYPSLPNAPFHTQHPRRLTVTRSMRLALLTIFLDVLLLFVSAAGAFRRVRKPDTRK